MADNERVFVASFIILSLVYCLPTIFKRFCLAYMHVRPLLMIQQIVLHTFTMKQLTGLGELPYVMDLYGLNKQKDLNSLLARLPQQAVRVTLLQESL